MPRPYQQIVRLVTDGDPVDSGINTIFQAALGNIEHVKLLLEEANLGSTIMARAVTVDESVNVGQPVYYNTTSQAFEQALASAYVDLDTGELVTADSTQVWGVCYFKNNSTNADILLHGYVELDVSAAIDGTEAGLYHLSGTTAGKLTKEFPPVRVAVLYWDGDSKVYVNPTFSNVGAEHQHLRFSLQPVPAGTHVIPSPGGHHSITGADDTIEGWLPSTDPIFLDKAPEEAAFGYNLSASALNNVWPPLPTDSCTISWTREQALDTQDVDLPGDMTAYGESVENQTFNDGTTTTVSKAVAGPSPIADGVVSVFSSIYTDEGLTISNPRVSAVDTVAFEVTNQTGASVDVTGTLKIVVYDIETYAVTDATDFTEDVVPDGVVRIDTNGIWWMTDCYGLVPWPVDYGGAPPVVSTTETVVTGGKYGITRSADDGTDILTVARGEDFFEVNDVAVDPTLYHVYATVESTQSVIRVHSNESSTGPTVLFTGTGSSNPFGIDYTSEYVYFTDLGDGKIYRMHIDGEEVTELVTGLTSPKGLRLDTGNEHIYFVDDTKIRRCDLDGANVTDIVTGLSTPQFLALDVANDDIYWTDTGSNKIQSSTLLGASVTDIVTAADAVGIDLDLVNNLIYFSTSTDLIRHCTLLGASITTVRTLISDEALTGLRLEVLPAPTAELCGNIDMELTLWLTKPQFQTANTVVTSLRAAEDSGLVVRCIHNDDDSATTGDLEVDFDTSFLVGTDDDEEGHLVFKVLEDNTFERGPVVEGIVIDSDYVSATSTAEGEDAHQGIVTISFSPTPVGSDLAVEEVRLNGVTEEFYEDVLGLSFPEGVDSEYRAKVKIPYNVDATTVRIKLRFVVLARAAGDIPALTLDARVITRPGQTTATALTLPTTDSAVTISVATATGLVEDEYIELESDEIEAAPGDLVLFTLGRAGSGDSFAGEIQVIDQRGVISSIV
jgi:hypothetical protein